MNIEPSLRKYKVRNTAKPIPASNIPIHRPNTTDLVQKLHPLEKENIIEKMKNICKKSLLLSTC